MCSLFSTRLACPLSIHTSSGIGAREEADEEWLSLNLAQAISDFLQKTFGNVVGQDDLAIGLVFGHGGVVWLVGIGMWNCTKGVMLVFYGDRTSDGQPQAMQSLSGDPDAQLPRN